MSIKTRSIFQGLLVTFLWSTSWILVKVSQEEFSPLIFSGMRYFLAALILLPGTFRHKEEIKNLSRNNWIRLGVLGLVYYAVTQGSIYAALEFLDATSLSLILNFTSVFVAVSSIFFLKEIPTKKNWIGIGLFLFGAMIYFYPTSDFSGQILGVILAGIAVAANAASGLLGRAINREKILPVGAVTAISMCIGGSVLFGVGLATEPLPEFSIDNIAILAWLILINTAFAFSLWNHTLRHLTAVESSIINNTMLIQMAVLAWIFLGERLGLIEMIGLVFASAGLLFANQQPQENQKNDLPGKTESTQQ